MIDYRMSNNEIYQAWLIYKKADPGALSVSSFVAGYNAAIHDIDRKIKRKFLMSKKKKQQPQKTFFIQPNEEFGGTVCYPLSFQKIRRELGEVAELAKSIPLHLDEIEGMGGSFLGIYAGQKGWIACLEDAQAATHDLANTLMTLLQKTMTIEDGLGSVLVEMRNKAQEKDAVNPEDWIKADSEEDTDKCFQG